MVGVASYPGKGEAFHRANSTVGEVVGSDALVGKCSAKESSEE